MEEIKGDLQSLADNIVNLYSQKEITLMMNHINSISRESLNGCTPYKLSLYLLNNKLHEVMELEEILPDEIRLKPSLLK